MNVYWNNVTHKKIPSPTDKIAVLTLDGCINSSLYLKKLPVAGIKLNDCRDLYIVIEKKSNSSIDIEECKRCSIRIIDDPTGDSKINVSITNSEKISANNEPLTMEEYNVLDWVI